MSSPFNIDALLIDDEDIDLSSYAQPVETPASPLFESAEVCEARLTELFSEVQKQFGKEVFLKIINNALMKSCPDKTFTIADDRAQYEKLAAAASITKVLPNNLNLNSIAVHFFHLMQIVKIIVPEQKFSAMFKVCHFFNIMKNLDMASTFSSPFANKIGWKKTRYNGLLRRIKRLNEIGSIVGEGGASLLVCK